MKKRFLILSFLLFLFAETKAQDSLPPVYEITSDTTTFVFLPPNYWQVLEDKDSKWSFDQVSKTPIVNEFHIDSSQQKGIDYSIQTFWIRFILKNARDKSLTVTFNNTNEASQTDFYYHFSNGNSGHKVTGYFYPLSKSDGLKSINAIPVTLKAGETVTVYNRVNNNYFVFKPKYLTAGFGSYEKILQQHYEDYESNYFQNSMINFFNGILLFAIVINILFFSIVRERVYAYYILFLTYLFLVFSDWPYLFFPDNISLCYYITMLISPAGIICYIQFTRYFFETFEKVPKWDKFLNFLCIILSGYNFLSFFIDPRLNWNWYVNSQYFFYILTETSLVMIIVTFLLLRNSKNKSVRLLFMSGLPVLIYETVVWIPMKVYDYLSKVKGTQKPGIVLALESWDIFINALLMSWLAVAFSWILFQRFLKLQKQNAEQATEKERLLKEKETERAQMIEQQKTVLEKTVEERTAELKKSLQELKDTQSQLVQSEKMASLGQLTAGIAHEIQNPLNFVNNFSDINKELLTEMRAEIAKGNYGEVNTLAKDLEDNEEKISHHGKRADAIVKGMLQHSRSGSGAKELTDINKLADEYLRLAYHGLRAKEKSFNVSLQTDYDKSIGPVNIISQDIGRVILNLINNAFYAVNEKKKQKPTGFEPVVSVSTKRVGDKIEITISDNGNGIPIKIVDKIFQPFFTTKPTGQGTGLGLSLAYDIVKAHGGEIRVETKETESTTFRVQLPHE